ncbi:MAG TPA: hypothetical protein VMV25_02850 [Steroidobacteraceae bacterium]|nr:hypothetical protein [Steroidobacteraceae bacterium]
MAVTERGQEISLVKSTAQRQRRRLGDSPLKGDYEAVQVPADDSRQRSLTAHLNLYYDAVIAAVEQAGGILIFGPGEAKDELEKRLKRRHLGARIAAVETADKMTDRQIVAKVRRHFLK